MAVVERRANQTTFGSLHAGNCVLAVQSSAGTGSCLILVQPNGTEKAIYVDDTGDLIIGTYAQFVAASGGTVVGGQS